MLEAVLAVAPTCADGFAPGQVAAYLRDKNTPMGAWEVRLELSELQYGGEIEVEPSTARWRLTEKHQGATARTGT